MTDSSNGDQLSLIPEPDKPPGSTRALIAEWRAQGDGWPSIAHKLNRRGVATPSGKGAWHATSVKHHYDRASWNEYMRSYRRRRR